MLDYKQDTASFNTRNDDYRACFATFEQYPLFGCGMMNDKAIFLNMFKDRNHSLSNGFCTLLAHTGVVGVGLVSIIYGIGIVNSMNKNKYNLLLIGAMIINHVLLVGVYSYEFILVLAFMLSLSPRLLLYEDDIEIKEELLLY
jgi:O-antigen ligase